MNTALTAATIAAATTLAAAQPIVFDIDQQNSQAALTITVSIDGLGTYADNDTAAIDGTLTANLDDPESPTLATLLDLDAQLLSDLTFTYSPPLSSASAVLSDAAFTYAGDLAGIGPVPVTAGSATFPQVPVAAEGIVDINYNIFLVGSGSEQFDLSTAEPQSADANANFSTANGIITVTNSFPINITEPLMLEGGPSGTVTVTGTVSIVANADIPECPADLDASGSLDFGDVSTFLTLFAQGDLAVDFDMSGSLDFGDVSTFLALFAQGCP